MGPSIRRAVWTACLASVLAGVVGPRVVGDAAAEVGADQRRFLLVLGLRQRLGGRTELVRTVRRAGQGPGGDDPEGGGEQCCENGDTLHVEFSSPLDNYLHRGTRFEVSALSRMDKKGCGDLALMTGHTRWSRIS